MSTELNTMHFKLLSSVVLLFCTVGCGGITYQNPSKGELARIRLASNTPVVTSIYRYELEGCNGNEEALMRIRNGNIYNSPVMKLGIGFEDEFLDTAAKEIVVEASRPLHLMFQTQQLRGALVRCGVPLTVQLKAGRDYEAVYFLDQKSCGVLFSEITGTGKEAKRLPISQFNNNYSSSKSSDTTCEKRITEYRPF